MNWSYRSVNFYSSHKGVIAETGQIIIHKPHLIHLYKKVEIPSTSKLVTGQIIEQYAQPIHF